MAPLCGGSPENRPLRAPLRAEKTSGGTRGACLGPQIPPLHGALTPQVRTTSSPFEQGKTPWQCTLQSLGFPASTANGARHDPVFTLGSGGVRPNDGPGIGCAEAGSPPTNVTRGLRTRYVEACWLRAAQAPSPGSRPTARQRLLPPQKFEYVDKGGKSYTVPAKGTCTRTWRRSPRSPRGSFPRTADTPRPHCSMTQ